MSGTLARWNLLPIGEAAKEILPCCGSTAWADGMAARRPLRHEATLLAASDETWRNLAKADWMEAFRSPRIGESGIGESGIGESGIGESRNGEASIGEWQSSHMVPARSSSWSKREQQPVTTADDNVKAELAQANKEYERRFNRIFIVCATGKSGRDILDILRRRLGNDDATELYEAAEEQRMITHIRLKKWLSQ